MNTIKIDKRKLDLLIKKIETSPGTLIEDSVEKRSGVILALCDLGLIDGLSGTRMLMEIITMFRED